MKKDTIIAVIATAALILAVISIVMQTNLRGMHSDAKMEAGAEGIR